MSDTAQVEFSTAADLAKATDHGPACEIDKLHARIRELEDEVSSVRAEAVEAVEFWGEFASKYSKVKHGLADDIASLRGAIAAAPSEPALRDRHL